MLASLISRPIQAGLLCKALSTFASARPLVLCIASIPPSQEPAWHHYLLKSGISRPEADRLTQQADEDNKHMQTLHQNILTHSSLYALDLKNYNVLYGYATEAADFKRTIEKALLKTPLLLTILARGHGASTAAYLAQYFYPDFLGLINATPEPEHMVLFAQSLFTHPSLISGKKDQLNARHIVSWSSDKRHKIPLYQIENHSLPLEKEHQAAVITKEITQKLTALTLCGKLEYFPQSSSSKGISAHARTDDPTPHF